MAERRQLTEVEVGGAHQRAENATDDDGADGERVLLVGNRGVHGKGLVEILLLLIVGLGGGLLDLDIVRLEVGRGLDWRLALRERADGARAGGRGGLEGLLFFVHGGVDDLGLAEGGQVAPGGGRVEWRGETRNPRRAEAQRQGGEACLNMVDRATKVLFQTDDLPCVESGEEGAEEGGRYRGVDRLCPWHAESWSIWYDLAVPEAECERGCARGLGWLGWVVRAGLRAAAARGGWAEATGAWARVFRGARPRACLWRGARMLAACHPCCACSFQHAPVIRDQTRWDGGWASVPLPGTTCSGPRWHAKWVSN